MSEAAKQNRVVWLDIPVADLKRAVGFYRHVLDINVFVQSFEGGEFAVFDHDESVGGCLIVQPESISDKGTYVYLNVDGRLRDAVEQTKANGGEVLQDIHGIGPHGFRAIILDSEGNRMVLHAYSDQ